MTLFTHLNFGGNCEEAFRFYAEQLGRRITVMMMQSQFPGAPPLPPGQKDTVLHARMAIAGVELIGNDISEARFLPVRSSHLYLALDSTEDAERVYAPLSEGGKVATPLEENFFAFRFAQLRDRFGVLWTILHPRNTTASA